MLTAETEHSGHLNYSFISLTRLLANHVFAISTKEQFSLKENVSPGSEMFMQYLYYGICKEEKEIFNLLSSVCLQEGLAYK